MSCRFTCFGKFIILSVFWNVCSRFILSFFLIVYFFCFEFEFFICGMEMKKYCINKNFCRDKKDYSNAFLWSFYSYNKFQEKKITVFTNFIHIWCHRWACSEWIFININLLHFCLLKTVGRNPSQWYVSLVKFFHNGIMYA